MKPSIANQLKAAKKSSYQLATLTAEQKNTCLSRFAELLSQQKDKLLVANQKDLEEQQGKIAPALYQRLKLTTEKIDTLIQGLKELCSLPDPVGKVTLKTILDEGLELSRVTVPVGVIAIVFESRPDVIPQILGLALKSANAVVLKGGREAHHSNRAFFDVVKLLEEEFDFVPSGWVQLLESREEFREILAFPQYIDLVIPRGSNALVKSIMQSTQIPVLGHADGVCHMFIDKGCDVEQAIALAIDSKKDYPAACNALETVLVDSQVAREFLKGFYQQCRQHQISIRAEKEVADLLADESIKEPDSWHVEYGDLRLSVKIVNGLAEAIEHINQHGSHHTDCIISKDQNSIATFQSLVDSASVFVNASTRFADGFRFGFGAEVGISTARTHARGPVGIEGLVIYKYLLTGHGQTVAPYNQGERSYLHKRLI